MSAPHVRAPRVGFLFIGGAHHMLHTAPVAVELAKRGGCDVRLLVGTAADRDRLAAVVERLGHAFDIELLPMSAGLKLLASAKAEGRPPKQLQLLAARRMLRAFDLLVTAERTSTILKRVSGLKRISGLKRASGFKQGAEPTPRLLHIPHGAGDRERGFERRMRFFDHVIVAGDKDRDRVVADGLVQPADVSVSGYVKLSAILRIRAGERAPRLFANDHPVILYNPHFEAGLGSWSMFGDAFGRVMREMKDHNFILAPHVRLAERLSARERERMQSLCEPGRVIVDLGSERSCDMSYTLTADLYVGDVSSQVYEYLYVPKPCVFLNATGGDRSDDRNFAFWRFGEVVNDPGMLARAIADAPHRHAGHMEAQCGGAREALGRYDLNAAATAAEIVEHVARAGLR